MERVERKIHTRMQEWCDLCKAKGAIYRKEGKQRKVETGC